MMIAYTFRSNGSKTSLENILSATFKQRLFVISKPTVDIPILLSMIDNDKPKWAVGFAEVKRGDSRWERYSINRFGKGKVTESLPVDFKIKHGRPIIDDLFNHIQYGSGMTASFCNQAAFRVAHHIQNKHPATQSAFLHYNPRVLYIPTS